METKVAGHLYRTPPDSRQPEQTGFLSPTPPSPKERLQKQSQSVLGRAEILLLAKLCLSSQGEPISGRADVRESSGSHPLCTKAFLPCVSTLATTALEVPAAHSFNAAAGPLNTPERSRLLLS